MKKHKRFAALAVALAVAMMLTASASTPVRRETLNADYMGIQITLDGEAITPRDANGAAVEPFAVNGTTYLPVRAIADALGLDVAWDGETNTVKLTREGATRPAPTAEIALITDIGTIDDRSFNQAAWEGIKTHADTYGISYVYYQPMEQSNNEYLAKIKLAVENGAKVIVCPGFLFEESVYYAQDLYPNVTFILIDGSPNSGDWSKGGPDYKTGSNTVAITYAEEQAGYLAGYAAVKGGYTKLGFMGGMAVPAVVNYGFGFIQGADDAAAELGISEIEMQYFYTGGFDARPEVRGLAASWYKGGTEVIFACGGMLGFSVMQAAEESGKFVIGVDIDQSSESNTVITSAMKGLSNSVAWTLGRHYSGRFPGGQNLVFDASLIGVMLPMSTTKINGFTQADYNAVFARLANGEVEIPGHYTMEENPYTWWDAPSPLSLELQVTKITLVP